MIHKYIPLRNARIKAAYEAGVLVDKISTEHGLAINTVFFILRKLKAREPNPAGPFAVGAAPSLSPGLSKIEKLRALAAAGKTRREIAAELGMHYNDVCVWAKKEGVYILRQPGTGISRRHFFSRKKPAKISPALKITAELLRRLKRGEQFTLFELARAANVTKEYAGQIYATCEVLGIIPKERRAA